METPAGPPPKAGSGGTRTHRRTASHSPPVVVADGARRYSSRAALASGRPADAASPASSALAASTSTESLPPAGGERRAPRQRAAARLPVAPRNAPFKVECSLLAATTPEAACVETFAQEPCAQRPSTLQPSTLQPSTPQPSMQEASAGSRQKREKRERRAAAPIGGRDARATKSHSTAILIVSSIKGRLSLLNEAAASKNVQAIIHTGDFGFYDEESWRTLPAAELRRAAAARALRDLSLMTDTQVQEAAREDPSVLSDLHEYTSGRRRLSVPVYTIWGEHEDCAVVRRFAEGTATVHNLHVLSPGASVTIPRRTSTLSSSSVDLEAQDEGRAFRIFALGGTVSYGRLFDVGTVGSTVCSGDGGLLWATVGHIGQLARCAAQGAPQVPSDEVRLLVSNAGCIREPLLQLVAGLVGAQYTVACGPPGMPHVQAYNGAAIHGMAPSSLASSPIARFIRPILADLRTMWDQIYFALHEKFTYALAAPATALARASTNSSRHHIPAHCFSDQQRKEGAAIISSLEQVCITEAHLVETTHISCVEAPLGSATLEVDRLGGISLRTSSTRTQRAPSDRSAVLPVVRGEESSVGAAALAKCSSDIRAPEATAAPGKALDAGTEGDGEVAKVAAALCGTTISAEAAIVPLPLQEARSPSRPILNPELALYLTNLPKDITGAQVDDSLLSAFDVCHLYGATLLPPPPIMHC